MTVSTMDSGAGSVALVERPTLPKTRSTSGNVLSCASILCSTLPASVMDIPGSAVGIKRMLPSFKGGINSLPNCRATGQVSTSDTTATAITGQRNRMQKRIIGRNKARSHRFSGLRSAWILPRTSKTASAGIKVTDKIAAKAML